MTDTNPEIAPEVEPPVVSLPLPGNRLRQTREAGRMSLEEVAHHLHLDVQIIKSLEDDMYDRLPSPIYISGYLRAYARLLKLPEKEIVGAYTHGREINASLIPENINILPGKKPVKPGMLKLIVLVIIAVIILAGLLWLSEETDLFNGAVKQEVPASTPLVLPSQQSAPISSSPVEQAEPQFFTEQHEQPEPDVTISNEPELTPPSVQEIEQKIAEQKATTPRQPEIIESPLNQTDGDLRLVFSEDSWVEVTDSAGTRHIYRLIRSGSELYVDGQAPFKILLGKANGVKVFYKGEEFDHTRYHRDDIAYFRIGTTE